MQVRQKFNNKNPLISGLTGKLVIGVISYPHFGELGYGTGEV